MKCKEVRTVTKRSSVILPVPEITAHLEVCPACHNLLLLDKLAPALIKAAGMSDYGTGRGASSALLISGIRNRIQEMREQRSSSWELAMESMRGWLAAFAVTAALLIALSIQWQPSVVTSDFDHDGDETVTQNPTEYLISDTPDPITLAPIGKNNPYAYK